MDPVNAAFRNQEQDQEETLTRIMDSQNPNATIHFHEIFVDFVYTGDTFPYYQYAYSENFFVFAQDFGRLYRLWSDTDQTSDYEVGKSSELQSCIGFTDGIYIASEYWFLDPVGSYLGADPTYLPLQLVYTYDQQYSPGYHRSAIVGGLIESGSYTKTTKTYSGITNPSPTHKAYYFQNATRGDCDDAGTEFTTSAYTAISTSDDSDAVVAASSGNYSKARFEIKITESLTDLKAILITVECAPAKARLWLYNPSDSTWYQMAKHWDNDNDQSVIINMGISPDDYVSSNYLKFCLEGEETNADLNIDYVRVDFATYSGANPSASILYPWDAQLYHDPQYDGRDFNEIVAQMGEEITFTKSGEYDKTLRGLLDLRLQITTSGYQYFFYPAHEGDLIGYSFTRDGKTFTVDKIVTTNIGDNEIFKKAYMSYT